MSGAVLAILLVCQPLFARPWTDTTGRTIEAKFVRVYQGNVVLLRGKKVVQVPFYNLSEGDQQFVRDELEKSDKSYLIPAPPAQASNDEIAGSSNTGSIPPPTVHRPNFSGPRFGPPQGSMPPAASAKMAELQANHARMLEQVKAEHQRLIDQSRARREERMRPAPTPAQPPWASTSPQSAPAMAHGHESTMPTYEQMARPQPTRPHTAPPTELASASNDYSYSAPSMQKQCESCNGIVSDNAKVGDRCPHCGVKWDYDDTTGESSSTRSWRSRRGLIKGGIFVIVVVCGLLAKLFKGSD
jgi:hypothetical protein